MSELATKRRFIGTRVQLSCHYRTEEEEDAVARMRRSPGKMWHTRPVTTHTHTHTFLCLSYNRLLICGLGNTHRHTWWLCHFDSWSNTVTHLKPLFFVSRVFLSPCVCFYLNQLWSHVQQLNSTQPKLKIGGFGNGYWLWWMSREVIYVIYVVSRNPIRLKVNGWLSNIDKINTQFNTAGTKAATWYLVSNSLGCSLKLGEAGLFLIYIIAEDWSIR